MSDIQSTVTVSYTLPELICSFDQSVNFAHALSGQLLKDKKIEIDGQDIMNAMVTVLGFTSSEELEQRFEQMNNAINESNEIEAKKQAEINETMEQYHSQKIISNNHDKFIIDAEAYYKEYTAIALFGDNSSFSKNEIFGLYQESKEVALSRLISNVNTYINSADEALSVFLLDNLPDTIISSFTLNNDDDNKASIHLQLNRNLAVYLASKTLESCSAFMEAHDPKGTCLKADVAKFLEQRIFGAYTDFACIMTKQRLKNIPTEQK